ncbi:thiamine-phosphate kinase [Motilibacter rhizosphaerae]|uniref:Thiamine-monophosphate kinase n=1 Tax=Motilibacter rhizosphaerae TaxID=598652 RepID=A0A4Q7NPK1_9ACTN|nr:thiamine-phosphate kinase [Motilibacter rhizosphaerae]
MDAEVQATPTTPTVREAGEFAVVAAVTARLPQSALVLLGPGDDAAVVRAPDGRVVVTTDVLVEGVHFRRDWSSALEVGRKAAAQNLADVAAMGAVPTSVVVGLAAPADLPVAWAESLADGLRTECAVVSVSVVGGDMTRAGQVVISVTALGDLEGRDPVTRSGARPGDLVVVAGRLGRSAAGLALHLRGDAGLLQRHAELAAAHRVPAPPYAAGPALARAGASALLDTSDGLLQDLGHVARGSGVRLELDAAALEDDVRALAACAEELGEDPWAWVLGGGEDHALAGCVPAGTALPPGVRVVGRVVAGSPEVVVPGVARPGSTGWDSYR